MPLSYSPPKLASIDDLVPKDAEGKPLVVRRKPGRPRKRVVPSIAEVELAALVNEQRDEFVARDGLVHCVERNTPSAEILHAVVLELAVESAALRQEIRSAQSASKSEGVAQKMSRRIDCLAKMAAISMERQKLGLVEIDLNSEAVQRVFRFFVEAVGDVARKTLSQPDEFMTRCEQGFLGWEERARLDSP